MPFSMCGICVRVYSYVYTSVSMTEYVLTHIQIYVNMPININMNTHIYMSEQGFPQQQTPR